MPQGAAFFDLDRTLLAGASGPVLGAALRRAGIAPRALPGEGVAYRVFEVLGENLPSIALARQAASLSRGRVQASVQAAAAEAADTLVDMIQPYARALLASHRAAGRPLVLATTTPYDLVEPLALALGFDAVVATRYGVTEAGLYDGTIDGPFVWAQGKLDAVQAWAEAHDVDLGESWFYSDSVFDTPLLNRVGHPVAVNPDPRMVVMALARGWPRLHLDVPPGVAKVPVLNLEPQQLALALARPELMPFVRFDVQGADRVPRRGGAIVVANHRSYFDVAALGVLLARAGRTARFLGKRELFDAPVVGPLVRAFGGIEVDRGSGRGQPLLEAAAALEAGQLVVILPQGTIPRGPDFFEPELQGRSGAARLAQDTGAPVVPVGLWATEEVWPRSSRVPYVWNVLHPPCVQVHVGEPVSLKGAKVGKDTRRIMRAITGLLPVEARQPKVATAEELARTWPPGGAPTPVDAPPAVSDPPGPG